MSDIIKFSIKSNETDEEMLELFSKEADGRKLLWAVVHSDIIFENNTWKDRLREGETINIKLIEDCNN